MNVSCIYESAFKLQTRQIFTQEEFQQFLMVNLEPMLQHRLHLRPRPRLPLEESQSRNRIGLIILDSLTGLFRIPDEGLGGGELTILVVDINTRRPLPNITAFNVRPPFITLQHN